MRRAALLLTLVVVALVSCATRSVAQWSQVLKLNGTFASSAFFFNATEGMIGTPRLEGDFRLLPDGTLAGGAVVRKTATAATTRSALGLPFYSGPVRYWQRFNLADQPGKSVRLRCDGIAANVAAVRINGVDCGAVRWAPNEVEVTAALKRGKTSAPSAGAASAAAS